MVKPQANLLRGRTLVPSHHTCPVGDRRTHLLPVVASYAMLRGRTVARFVHAPDAPHCFLLSPPPPISRPGHQGPHPEPLGSTASMVVVERCSAGTCRKEAGWTNGRLARAWQKKAGQEATVPSRCWEQNSRATRSPRRRIAACWEGWKKPSVSVSPFIRRDVGPHQHGGMTKCRRSLRIEALRKEGGGRGAPCDVVHDDDSRRWLALTSGPCGWPSQMVGLEGGQRARRNGAGPVLMQGKPGQRGTGLWRS